MRIRVPAVFLLLLATGAFAADAGIAFTGILTHEGKTKIALTDTATEATRWLDLGDLFNGYTVVTYRPKDDAVIIRKDGQDVRLSLSAPRTPDPAASAAAAVTLPQPAVAPSPPDALNAIRYNLRQLAAAARQFHVERGVTTATYSDLVGPDKYIKELTPVEGENYSSLVITPETPSLVVTTTRGETVSLQIAATPEAGAMPDPASLPGAAPPGPDGVSATPDPAAVNVEPAPAAAGTAPAAAPAGTSADPAAAPDSSTPPATPVEATPPTPGADATPHQPAAHAPPDRLDASYVIQPGDTLETIAQATGLSVPQLQSLNPDVNPNAPRVGQSIRLR